MKKPYRWEEKLDEFEQGLPELAKLVLILPIGLAPWLLLLGLIALLGTLFNPPERPHHHYPLLEARAAGYDDDGPIPPSAAAIWARLR
jgi:hypothetical protein